MPAPFSQPLCDRVNTFFSEACMCCKGLRRLREAFSRVYRAYTCLPKPACYLSNLNPYTTSTSLSFSMFFSICFSTKGVGVSNILLFVGLGGSKKFSGSAGFAKAARTDAGVSQKFLNRKP